MDYPSQGKYPNTSDLTRHTPLLCPASSHQRQIVVTLELLITSKMSQVMLLLNMILPVSAIQVLFFADFFVFFIRRIQVSIPKSVRISPILTISVGPGEVNHM